MELWDNIQSLRSLSHCLLWSAAILPIIGAALGSSAVISRFYVERRIGDLSVTAQAEKEAKLRADFDEARQRQESAEAEMITLRAKVAPRHLSKPQRLIAELHQGPTGAITVLASMLDPEAKFFASELATALRETGWRVDFPTNTIPVHAPEGITIAVSAAAEAPSRAGYLQAALKRCGIDAKGVADTELSPGQVTLIVGQKP